mmetsp:Transcript_40616/g.73120  ORF Transcript_40616/g.73120 Transcript_40616/m.73120 type:complete len:250 (-) Transcript_40616:56-805(-)
MFKKVKHPDFIVAHRMGGNHAKRDMLDDEVVGSGKRCRVEDGSSSVVYKETPQERKARLQAEKEQERELRRAEKEGRKASVLNIAKPEPSKPAGTAKPEKASTGALAKLKEAQSKLSSFKDRLKASNLPEAAEKAEQKHKEDVEEEKRKALEKYSKKPSEGSTPDSDERLTMNDIWKQAEEDTTENWLDGGGLKFHTTADKAFSMASGRFKEATASKEQVENREAEADLAKKRSALRMAEMIRKKGPGD